MERFNQPLDTPSIPTSYSRIAARTLGLQEKQLDRLLANTGVSVPALLRDDFLLSGHQQIQILSNALDISGDPAFGLYFGQKLTPPTHGPLGFLVHSSPTLIAALNAFKNYLPLRMNLTQIEINIRGNWLQCELYADHRVGQKVYRLFHEALILTLLSISEFILARPLKEAVLNVTYPAPDYEQLYQKICPCQVNFSRPASTLQIPLSLMHTANASADHINYEHALSQCRGLLEELKSDHGSTHNRVRKLLLTNPNHQLLEADVAAALFVSQRTLARRLSEEGTTFRQVREEVLASLAAGYLSNTTLSVDAISGLLNYHDSSNFRRAFKRWYQQPPEQYRRSRRVVN